MTNDALNQFSFFTKPMRAGRTVGLAVFVITIFSLIVFTKKCSAADLMKPQVIEDPSGLALQHFYESLKQTEQQAPASLTRIIHYGDSPIMGGMLTSTVRRKLQLRFGDAGHGFVLLAKPWGWYQHLGVRHEASGWESDPMFIGKGDHRFGFGGAIITRPTISTLVAAETGCAFFDTFTAMGGEGTVTRWREAKPTLMGGDLTHPTWQGSEIVGSLIHDALLRAYERNVPKA